MPLQLRQIGARRFAMPLWMSTSFRGTASWVRAPLFDLGYRQIRRSPIAMRRSCAILLRPLDASTQCALVCGLPIVTLFFDNTRAARRPTLNYFPILCVTATVFYGEIGFAAT